MPDVRRLGRSVVVGPGQAPPAAWSDCERRSVTAVSGDAADELTAAWLERRSLVIELTPGLGLDDPGVPPAETIVGVQPWEWPVDLDLPGERLHHALWANSVDGRGEGPLAWRWADEARRLGARPDPSGTGDILVGGGEPAVCDGGPLDAALAERLGAAVLHRISIEHGRLDPLAVGRGVPSPGLADDQLAAVTEPLGGVRVIAPAGSGKTRVLTERARLLIREWQLPPAALALVAYNVRAAGEVRDRLADIPSLRIRTLNALGLRLCGRAATLDETEVRRVLGGLVALPRRAETDPAAPWIEALSRVRLGLADPRAVEDELGDVSDLERVARSYRAALAERDGADFDEQIAAAVERLLGDPAFRARSQRFARVLLVDEFQDLTPAHLLLLRLLSGPAGSVFAVGDDDQTIYGYAGATPRWLVEYAKWFPGSASHSLEVNYRCPTGVVTAASNLLSRNAVRVPKTIRAADRTGDGLTVVDPGAGGPAARTAARVEEILAAGAAPGDIAVLSRVNASLVPVHVLLSNRGVPVEPGGDRRFLQRGGVRAALAWLEVASAPSGQLSGAALREAARRPKRGMSNGVLDLIARPRSLESLEGLSVWLESKDRARDAEKVDGLARDVATVQRAAGRGTAKVLEVIRRQIGSGGLDASASALDLWSHGAIAAHADDLDALAELADLEPDPARFAGWLADRLAAPPQPGGVVLASIHAVKGREWDHVVIHHATDGLIPHRLATDDEEERRIFHVGLTRGIRSVSVIPGQTPSPFIAEMAAAGQPGDRAQARGADRAEGRGGDQAHGRAVRPTGREADGRRTAGKRGTSPPSGGPGASPSPGGRTPALDILPATAGLEFRAGGQDHRIAAIERDGAVCLIGGGPARTLVRFGTPVTHGGRSAVLAHPAAGASVDRLRSWRTAKAKELAVPPYVVFDDATLRLLATHLPVTESALLSVRGIGPAKLDAYGSELLEISEEMRAGVAPSP